MRWLILVLAAGMAAAVGGCSLGDDSDAPPPSTGALATGKSEPEFGRNVVRIPGLSPTDVTGAAILAAYAPEAYEPPNGWVFVRKDRWQEAMLAAQFAAKPVKAGIVPIDKDFLPTAAADLLLRLRPEGFPRGEGLQVLLIGRFGSDVLLDMQDQSLQPAQLNASSPAKLGLELVPYRGGWAAEYSSTVVIASSEERTYALPAAAWSAYTGDTLAFVDRRGVPPSTATLLAQRQKLRLERPSIYVVGPSSVIPDAVLAQLSQYGRVKRIAGRNAVETAVEFARFRDPATGFGWGLRRGPASVSLVNPRDWANAVGAFTFAAVGPQAPLLLTDRAGRLPGPVVDYLRDLQPGGPNQGYVFGDRKSVESAVVAELDALLEAGAGR